MTSNLKIKTQPRCSRREWLTGSARYAALAGVSLLSAGLVVKRALMPADERCLAPAACRGCASLAECRLPAAVEARTGERR